MIVPQADHNQSSSCKSDHESLNLDNELQVFGNDGTGGCKVKTSLRKAIFSGFF